MNKYRKKKKKKNKIDKRKHFLLRLRLVLILPSSRSWPAIWLNLLSCVHAGWQVMEQYYGTLSTTTMRS